MIDPTKTATEEPTIVTVFEHHDADGANLDVALVRRDKWHFLTVEEARDLADKLLDAAGVAEECSQEFEVPLRTRKARPSVRQRSGRITPILLWVRGSRTNPQQIGEKHGPDQDIAAPRHVVEFLEIALGLGGVEEIPLDQPGVKESLDRSLVESRIGDSKPKLGPEAAECAR